VSGHPFSPDDTHAFELGSRGDDFETRFQDWNGRRSRRGLLNSGQHKVADQLCVAQGLFHVRGYKFQGVRIPVFYRVVAQVDAGRYQLVELWVQRLAGPAQFPKVMGLFGQFPKEAGARWQAEWRLVGLCRQRPPSFQTPVPHPCRATPCSEISRSMLLSDSARERNSLVS